MKLSHLIILCFTSLAIFKCSDDAPTQSGLCNDIALCDTCDTYDPIAWGDTTIPNLTVYGLRKHPTRNIYAGSSYQYSFFGLSFFWDVDRDSIKILNAGARGVGRNWIEWSNDGNSLITFVGIYNVNTNTLNWWPSFLEPYDHRTFVWSMDDQWIFMESEGKTYKMRTDASEITLVAETMGEVRQLNDSLLIGFDEDALYTWNMITKEKSLLKFSRLPDNLIVNKKEDPNWQLYYHESKRAYWDLSPDRTKIIADVNGKYSNTSREERGLYCFDLEKQIVKRILLGQYWGQRYWPRWASNSSFFATYYCRKDKASMIYEFDLNGKSLRQVTFKEELRYYYP